MFINLNIPLIHTHRFEHNRRVNIQQVILKNKMYHKFTISVTPLRWAHVKVYTRITFHVIQMYLLLDRLFIVIRNNEIILSREDFPFLEKKSVD